MKFCSKCGKEIFDEAVICVHCGCQVQETKLNSNTASVTELITPGESSGLAACAAWFAVLIPIVGLILGIVGVCKYQTESYRNTCVWSIVLSIVFMIISAVVLSML